MSQIINNLPLYNLVKTGNYMYNLHIKSDNSKPLYLSLLKTKLLTNIFYNSEENSICFTAGKIETLYSLLETQIITESNCIKMSLSDIESKDAFKEDSFLLNSENPKIEDFSLKNN